MLVATGMGTMEPRPTIDVHFQGGHFRECVSLETYSDCFGSRQLTLADVREAATRFVNRKVSMSVTAMGARGIDKNLSWGVGNHVY